MRFRPVSEPNRGLDDATMRFRPVSELNRELDDPTMRLRPASQPADATDGVDDVNGYPEQPELRALVRSILADLKPREREVIELSFWHDLYDNDLAMVLGVSWSRAHALATRARARLEKSFGALRTALAGRQSCPVVRKMLADWDGQLTGQTLDLLIWHIDQCQTCADYGRGRLRPEALSSLLPLAPLPPELREQILRRCSSGDKDAVAYRRRVVRRADSTLLAIFPRGIRRLGWDSIRANPGAVIAVAAVAVWLVAAVCVTLFTFAGSSSAQDLVTRPSTRSSPSSSAPRAVTVTVPTTAPTSAPASPSPTVRPSPTYVPPTYVSSALPTAHVEPSRSASDSPSASKSAKPSKSPTPSPSTSPSRTPSPSPSKTP
jgi:hypothetical protein